VNGIAQPASPLSVGSVAQLAFSLAAIIAFILAVSWVLKRLKLGTARSRGDIAVIDQLALGPRERIVLVRVGESQVLLGLGSAGIVSLTPLATPIVVSPRGGQGPDGVTFAERLREFMKRPGSTP
jgi:flagellar protein FliO/FliZ